MRKKNIILAVLLSTLFLFSFAAVSAQIIIIRPMLPTPTIEEVVIVSGGPHIFDTVTTEAVILNGGPGLALPATITVEKLFLHTSTFTSEHIGLTDIDMDTTFILASKGAGDLVFPNALYFPVTETGLDGSTLEMERAFFIPLDGVEDVDGTFREFVHFTGQECNTILVSCEGPKQSCLPEFVACVDDLGAWLRGFAEWTVACPEIRQDLLDKGFFEELPSCKDLS